MKHLNYQTETFTLHVEVQDVLTQAEKELITAMFHSLVVETAKPKAIVHPKAPAKITGAEIQQQVLQTLIDRGQEVSCNLDGECRVPKLVSEVPPNLLKKSASTYKNARQKLYYKLKKARE